MELDEETTLVHDITSDEATKQPSLAEQLRARRAEISETKEVLLPVIGYEEFGLMAKHRLMDRPEVEKIGRKVMSETKNRGERNMRILLDTVINSTVGFYIRQNEEEEPSPVLDASIGDVQVLNWGDCARYLGWDPKYGDDARSALYFVFGGNEFAVGQYGILLNRWMGNTGINVDEELLGEGL